MTPEERTKLTNQMVLLSKENIEPPIKDSVDPVELEHALRQMADKVLEQIVSIKEDERMIVCMATMTKLLVENYILNVRLNGK